MRCIVCLTEVHKDATYIKHKCDTLGAYVTWCAKIKETNFVVPINFKVLSHTACYVPEDIIDIFLIEDNEGYYVFKTEMFAVSGILPT